MLGLLCVPCCYILSGHLLCSLGYTYTLFTVVAIPTARARGNMNPSTHEPVHEYRIVIDDDFWEKLAKQITVYQKLIECVARGTAREEDLDDLERCVLQLLEAVARPKDVGQGLEGGCVGRKQIARRRTAVEIENRELKEEIDDLKKSMCILEGRYENLSWCMRWMGELDDEVVSRPSVARRVNE